jgi:hypothetical protein
MTSSALAPTGTAMPARTTTSASSPVDALARFAELSETAQRDGKPMLTPEVLVFGLDGDGRIGRVDIFIETRRPVTT